MGESLRNFKPDSEWHGQIFMLHKEHQSGSRTKNRLQEVRLKIA